MSFRHVDTRPVLVIAARTVLPAVMGAIGAIVATILPVYHAAFCAGSI